MREAPEAAGRAKPSVPANSSSKLSTAPHAFAHLKNSSRHCEEYETLPCVVQVTVSIQSMRQRNSKPSQWVIGPKTLPECPLPG
jgi:hypothetical protein